MRNYNIKVYLITLLFVLLIVGCNSKDNYKLVWSDEFDYTGLPDSTLWGYDTEGNINGWGNNEEQFYTAARSENAWVENGKLFIHAIHEPYQNKDFTSARLISQQSWKHGKIEVRARIPEAKGTWSAIWMMPAGWTFNDGNWPDVGEIDIMEHVGHDIGTIHGSAHSKDYQWQIGTQQSGTIHEPSVTKEFHTYKLEWTEEILKWFVNDKLYFSYKNENQGESKWPYNKPFYLILNLAVGGEWGSVQGIDVEAYPQTMEIDYVRVYQLE